MALPLNVNCSDCCTCPSPTIQWDSRSASKTKCGFTEWGTPSSPPRFFRTAGATGTIDKLFGGLPDGDYNTYSGVYTYQPVDCAFDPSPSSSRFAYDAGVRNCGIAQDIIFIPSPSVVTATGVSFAFFTPSTGTGLDCTLPQGFSFNIEVDVVVAPDSATFTATGTNGSGSVVATSTDEYLTSELLANTLAALPAFDDDWNDTAGSYANTSTDETTRAIREGRYRVQFKIPKVGSGTCYKVTWTERFTPEVGDVVDTQRCKIWDGVVPGGYDPDDPSTYPIIGDGVNPYFEVPIPEENGEVTVVNVIATCRGCSGGC